MTPELWQRVKQLFQAALELSGPHVEAGVFLEEPAVGGSPDDLDGAAEQELPPGTRIGRFEVLGRLGAGAMGIVVEARRSP